MKLSKLKHVIFDLDGTMVNTERTVIKLINKIRCDRGLKPLEMNAVKCFFSLGGSDMIAKCFQDVNINLEDVLYDFRCNYLADDLNQDYLCPNVIDFIAKLRAKLIGVSLCTNKPKNLVRKVLLKNNIGSIFDTIITGDDVIEKKPSPEGIEYIIEKTSFKKSEYLMIGDSAIDQLAANQAGINFGYYCEDGNFNEKVTSSFRFENYKKLGITELGITVL
jgi:phosphoglycolate phosphatase